jgi:hypothetical protein
VSAAAERFKFVVYRDAWLRGDDQGDSCLLKGGHRCCLGFLGQALGIHDDEMSHEPCPSDLPNSPWPAWLLYQSGPRVSDSDIGNQLMKINDAGISDDERERKLTELFAAQGIDVEFRDGDGK